MSDCGVSRPIIPLSNVHTRRVQFLSILMMISEGFTNHLQSELLETNENEKASFCSFGNLTEISVMRRAQ